MDLTLELRLSLSGSGGPTAGCLLHAANPAFSFGDLLLHLYVCVNLLSVAMFTQALQKF